MNANEARKNSKLTEKYFKRIMFTSQTVSLLSPPLIRLCSVHLSTGVLCDFTQDTHPSLCLGRTNNPLAAELVLDGEELV